MSGCCCRCVVWGMWRLHQESHRKQPSGCWGPTMGFSPRMPHLWCGGHQVSAAGALGRAPRSGYTAGATVPIQPRPRHPSTCAPMMAHVAGARRKAPLLLQCPPVPPSAEAQHQLTVKKKCIRSPRCHCHRAGTEGAF